MKKIGIPLASIVLLLACGGPDPSGSYTGTLDGDFTDMDAPGPDGTAANRSFQFHESPTLVVSSAGDRAYRFALGDCVLSADHVASLEAPMLASAPSCNLAITGHGTIALTDASATVSLHADHADVVLDGIAARHADGMQPQLHATFTGDRAR